MVLCLCDMWCNGASLPSFFQSDVIDNHYGTTYSIKLLLDRRWQGDESDRTRHRSLKTIRTPFAPHMPVLINSESSPCHTSTQQLHTYSEIFDEPPYSYGAVA